MLSYRRYLFLVILQVSIAIIVIACISYSIDPAKIYHSNDELGSSPFGYSAKLLKSKYGLLKNQSFNERDVKQSLARQVTDADCAVIGSSTIMQVSSLVEDQIFKGICKSVINLGVSGASLEDHLALSYELLQNGKSPKTIIFGIDPWVINFQKDLRWGRYKQSYFAMKEIIERDKEIDNSERFEAFKYITNLLSLDYFIRSLRLIGQDKKAIVEAPKFDYRRGIADPVLLPDGSLIYSEKFVNERNGTDTPIGGTNYAFEDGSQISEPAFILYGKLLNYLIKEGRKLIIVFPPYQQNVWKSSDSVVVRALIEVEPRIKQLGEELNIPVLGSYNPDYVGCNSDEFYDQMHSKHSCLSKIKN
jgi:hypothetical protein